MSSAKGKVIVVGENVKARVWEDGGEGSEREGKATNRHGMKLWAGQGRVKPGRLLKKK